MIKSATRYFRYFFTTIFFRKERNILMRDCWALMSNKPWKKNKITQEEKEKCIHAAANWLLNNQKFNSDSGFSTYYIVEGHTASYPETSGYILDSLLHYSKQFSKPEILARLYACADWLLSIQKESGGWQSGYVNQNKKEVVFNTGQVMRGLLHAYKISGNEKYLIPCVKAADWLCSTQEEDGSWQRFAFMNVKRVYESYVSSVLLEVWKITQNEHYKNAAEKNIEWVIKNKIRPNGWLEDCDNTIKHNTKPILHTIAYTIDGVIDCGLSLHNNNYLEAIKKTADVLMEKYMKQDYLGGRFNENWEESESFICTGGAQMSICWLKLYRYYGENKYLEAAKKMNDWLCWIQRSTMDGEKEIKGALQGSFPIYGRYEPFAYPNWATKYLLDALMLEMEIG